MKFASISESIILQSTERYLDELNLHLPSLYPRKAKLMALIVW